MNVSRIPCQKDPPLRIMFGPALIHMKSREFRRLRRTRTLRTAGINRLLNFLQGDLPCEYLARLIRNHDAVASISQREVANEIALMEKGEKLIVGQVPGQAHIAHRKTQFRGRPGEIEFEQMAYRTVCPVTADQPADPDAFFLSIRMAQHSLHPLFVLRTTDQLPLPFNGATLALQVFRQHLLRLMLWQHQRIGIEALLQVLPKVDSDEALAITINAKERGLESTLDGGVGHSHLGKQFQRFRLDANGFGGGTGLLRAIDQAAADTTAPQVVGQRQANRPRSNDQNVMGGSR